jgi:hypothetical protein
MICVLPQYYRRNQDGHQEGEWNSKDASVGKELFHRGYVFCQDEAIPEKVAYLRNRWLLFCILRAKQPVINT